MSMLRTLKKNIKRSGTMYKFPGEMYSTLLGSFLVTLTITNKTTFSPLELSKFYKQEKRRWLKGNVNEDTWMEDIIKKLNDMGDSASIPYNQCAVVMSTVNMLVVPYLDLGDGPKMLPLREDGFYGPTIKYGKVFPITDKEEKTKEEIINGAE